MTTIRTADRCPPCTPLGDWARAIGCEKGENELTERQSADDATH
jgi:hypothetical protein